MGIEQVVELLKNYDFSHQRRLSFEYIVFKGVNDSMQHAKAIIKLVKGLDCRFNLIRFHQIPDIPLQGVNDEKMEQFRDYLTSHGVFTTIRASRGQDIYAACGLLSTSKKIGEIRQHEDEEKKSRRKEHSIMVRNTITLLFPFCLIFLLLTSCGLTGKNRKKPASTGQPYEIVLEGDTDSIVTRILTEDIPALPQPEPLCKLIQVKKGKTKGSYLLVRTRIIVNITDKDFAVKLSHDENAAPQNIIRINAHSVQQLRERLNGEKLRQIVDEAELKHLAEMISNNPSKQNKEMQEEVKKTFGLDMKIPVSMNASKKAKNFIWISNNASTGMQNLLVMKVKSEERRAGKEKSEERRMKNSNAFHVNVNDKAQIDSILRTNMPGETDSMYMTIPVLLERGLWEMKGDAMGGPYVMHRIHNLYVIGFVYAPEMKKKILIKQLEAAISTIK